MNYVIFTSELQYSLDGAGVAFACVLGHVHTLSVCEGGGHGRLQCSPRGDSLFTVYVAYKIANGTSECWNLGNRSSALKVSRLHLN